MGQYDGFAAGAYSCARCHTKGWSYSMPEVAGGGGALGFNLTGGSELRQFETDAQQREFVSIGSELGKPYGKGGIGSGQMPGFGLNPSAIDPRHRRGHRDEPGPDHVHPGPDRRSRGLRAEPLNRCATSSCSPAWPSTRASRGSSSWPPPSAILGGSVYLLLATNMGARLGLLVALAGLFGWLTILTLTWWIQPPGNGPRGTNPSWKPVEIYVSGGGSPDTEVLASLPPGDALPTPEEIIAAHPEMEADFPDPSRVVAHRHRRGLPRRPGRVRHQRRPRWLRLARHAGVVGR